MMASLEMHTLLTVLGELGGKWAVERIGDPVTSGFRKSRVRPFSTPNVQHGARRHTLISWSVDSTHRPLVR